MLGDTPFHQFIIIIIETVILSNFECRLLPSSGSFSRNLCVVRCRPSIAVVPSDVHSESPSTRFVHSLSSILAMCSAHACLWFATTAMTSLTLVIFQTPSFVFLVSEDSSKHFSLHAPSRNSRPLGGLLCKVMVSIQYISTNSNCVI